MGHDHRTATPKILVPAGVIEMPVGVDHEADRVGVERRDCRRDLVGERRELVVDDDVAVLAVGQANIAAGAEQHRHTGRNALHLDLDLGVILLLGCGRRGQKRKRKGEEAGSHVGSLRI